MDLNRILHFPFSRKSFNSATSPLKKMSTLPKPQLRGHLARYIVKSLAGATLISSFACACYYYFYSMRRKRAYAEFHKTYNAEEHIQLMKKYGYLQCAQNK